MMEMPVDHFTQEWRAREHRGPISYVLLGLRISEKLSDRRVRFHILKCLLWLRVVLRSLFDPLPAIEGVIRALISRPSSLSLSALCVAVVNLVLCVMVLVNTRYDVVLVLYGSHMVASLLLHQFLRFDTISRD
ncbi:hypothetical protein BDN72DRAFT_436637 [Pluteus cervinus]|uniref:Uncharacterized protein n=1 Tax=Pluteus cervinus TaxID=181527 RepID=A0ACD3B1K1_9AGAR|nr:hypothetical protein BDN72DRAFT_436637 [Pluteus cervinus]